MFTVLSVILFIQVLANGNLGTEEVILMLFFGWEIFLFVGLIIDGSIVLSILMMLLIVATIIVVLIVQSKNKKKRKKEEEIKEIDRINDERELERLRRENHG